jgi:taurine--2-oxoglutarate transaminase
MTMAKGLTSAYVQLGALGMRRHIAEHFRENVFYGGLTYNSHPLACATALAAIGVIEEDGLIERAARMGEVLRRHHEELRDRHPSVGAIRNIGLFGIVELVRNREPWTPMTAYNGTSDEMAALGKAFRRDGLYTFVRWNYFFTNPPLTISEAELAEGFEIIDRALTETDRALA